MLSSALAIYIYIIFFSSFLPSHTKAAGNKNTMYWIWLFWEQKLFKEDYEKNPAEKVLRYANWSIWKA